MNEKRLLIVLYGDSNQGKTTTLKELVLLLINGGIILPALRALLYKLLPSKGKNVDGRFILEVNNKRIYIATAGDTWAISRGNVDFFEGRHLTSMKIYRVTSSSIAPMSLTERKDFLDKKADICVCACSPDGDSTGAIKALYMYCEEAISNNYYYQLWLQKNTSMNNGAKAKELYDIVDKYIKSGKI